MLWPSDEFGNEELPSDQIAAFVARYGRSADGEDRCTVMAKAKVGTDAHPIWRAIVEALPGRPVDWNFAAWVLFDGTGAPVGRWGFSLQDIGNASFLSQLEAALAQTTARPMIVSVDSISRLKNFKAQPTRLCAHALKKIRKVGAIFGTDDPIGEEVINQFYDFNSFMNPTDFYPRRDWLQKAGAGFGAGTEAGGAGWSAGQH